MPRFTEILRTLAKGKAFGPQQCKQRQLLSRAENVREPLKRTVTHERHSLGNSSWPPAPPYPQATPCATPPCMDSAAAEMTFELSPPPLGYFARLTRPTVRIFTQQSRRHPTSDPYSPSPAQAKFSGHSSEPSIGSSSYPFSANNMYSTMVLPACWCYYRPQFWSYATYVGRDTWTHLRNRRPITTMSGNTERASSNTIAQISALQYYCYPQSGSGSPCSPPPQGDKCKPDKCIKNSKQGLIAKLSKISDPCVGPGVASDKSGMYKSPEYYCYDQYSFYDAYNDMKKQRLPPPKSGRKL